MQGHTAFVVTLGTRHFSATQTARAHNLNAFDLGLTHSGLDGFTHSATESHAVGKLFSNRLCNQLSVSINILHFEDVELNLLRGELFQLSTNTLSFSTTTPNDDARAGSVNINADAIAGALDVDSGHASTLQVFAQELADLNVLGNVLSVLLVGVPV